MVTNQTDTDTKNETRLENFKTAMSVANVILRRADSPVESQNKAVLFARSGALYLGAWNYEYGIEIGVTNADRFIDGPSLSIPADLKTGKRGWEFPTLDLDSYELSTWNKESRKLKAANDYRYVPSPTDRTLWFEIARHELIMALGFVTPGLALEDNRPILTGVHIRSIPGVGVMLESADGYRAHRYTIPDETVKGTFDTLLPGHMIPALIEFLGLGLADKESPKAVTLAALTGGYTEITSGRDRFVFMPIDGRFPDIDQILAISDLDKPFVRTAQVQYTAAQLIRPARGNQTVSLLVKNGCTRLLTPDFSTLNPDTESLPVDRPLPIQWDHPEQDTFWVGFNPRYLYDSLVSMGGLPYQMTLVIKRGGLQCTAVRFTADKRQIALMPMGFDRDHGWGPAVDSTFTDKPFTQPTDTEVNAILMDDRMRAVTLEKLIKRAKIELSALNAD